MATLENMKKIVVVKKDPAESYSTGGVVCHVGFIYKKIGTETWIKPGEQDDLPKYYEDNNYEIFEYTDDEEGMVGINWIKQDRTGIFYNPAVGIEE
tara:strand:+ start:254 stop:541 length:288 start_codon:yes stop_codon:yes gene_type:complete